MVKEDILNILRCPEHRTPLSFADERLVAALNRAVAEGRLKNRAGEQVRDTIEGGLLRDDRAILYPIFDDIPKMLIDDGIPLDQVEMEP